MGTDAVPATAERARGTANSQWCWGHGGIPGPPSARLGRWVDSGRQIDGDSGRLLPSSGIPPVQGSTAAGGLGLFRAMQGQGEAPGSADRLVLTWARWYLSRRCIRTVARSAFLCANALSRSILQQVPHHHPLLTEPPGPP